MGLILYIIVKLPAYISLCFVGLTRFRPQLRHIGGWAIGLGILRLIVGLFAGLWIYTWSNKFYNAHSDSSYRSVEAYLLVYPPVRWVEWSLMALLVVPKAWKPGAALLGLNAQDRLWRLSGILVSCLADIPVFLELGGLPVGRFFC
jgi:hypothetical protein